MYGLSVRWSLAAVGEGVVDGLRGYVRDASLPRFTGMRGLRFKTWRMRPGEWFEGTYVFATAGARDSFRQTFTAGMAQAPVSQLVGAPPALVESWEVVAVAEGGDGFLAGPGPRAATAHRSEV